MLRPLPAPPSPSCPNCQMTSFVTLGPLDTSQFADTLLAILRLQLPSGHAAPGFCVVHGLTDSTKVTLEVVLQLSVGVGMVVVYLGVAAGTLPSAEVASCICLCITVGPNVRG